MATITLENESQRIRNQIWKMGKIGFSGSKLKFIGISGPANETMLLQIIEFSDLALFGRFRIALTQKFH